MRLLGMTLAILLWSACGCKSGSKSGDDTLGKGHGNGPPPTAADCDGQREPVTRLYAQSYPAPPGESPEAAALRAQELQDNVAMVMADCKKDPARVVPCLQTVVSVKQLEQACLIPLDDEGNAEQQQFGAQ